MAVIDNQENIIIDADDFLLTIERYLGNQYSLGIHGIENSDCWIQVDGKWYLNTSKINEIKKTILDQGLHIKGSRKLLSTVRFDNLDDYLSPGYYDAGGVVVALPKVLKNSSGEEIYIGSPLDGDNGMDRNYISTCLSDMIIPDYSEENGNLNSMYILATYEKIDDKRIKLFVNEKHIYFNNGLLPDYYFDLKKKQIMEIYNSYGVNNLNDLLCQLDDSNNREVHKKL